MSFFKTLVATVPVSAIRAESLLGIRSHRLTDTLFVSALVILPMTSFLALALWLVPTTGMTGETDAGMFILPL
jgi:hypothetical protein